MIFDIKTGLLWGYIGLGGNNERELTIMAAEKKGNEDL
jgi:hypothetical protein